MSQHFGTQKEILGQIFNLAGDYGFPKGFAFDEKFDDADGPIQDDPTLSHYNTYEMMTKVFNNAHK
jgi:hypothetical protein